MKFDIYNFERRLTLTEARIRKSIMPEISKNEILKFETSCFAGGLGIARVEKYLTALKTLGEMLPQPLGEANKDTITLLVSRIERSPSWSAWTKHDYKVCLKKFYSYLDKRDLTSWIRAGRNHSVKLPEELLTPADVEEMLECSRTDRAFIQVLWESGARIGELLSLQVKNCVFDSIGVKIIVSGKTGMRRIRLIESAAGLDEIIAGGSSEERVFNFNHGAARMKIKRIARRAGIQKRVYAHLFRHSRATFLAPYMTEAQLCVYLGWVIGSGMPRVYIHLSCDDLDETLLKLPSLRNAVHIPLKDVNANVHVISEAIKC